MSKSNLNKKLDDFCLVLARNLLISRPGVARCLLAVLAGCRNQTSIKNFTISLRIWFENFDLGLGVRGRLFALPRRMSTADLDQKLEDLSSVLAPNL